MHRPTVGCIALVLLVLALLAPLWDAERTEAWQSGCLRVGLLMAALWLALPHLQGVRPIWLLTFLLGALGLLMFAAKHPLQMALLAGIGLLLGYMSLNARQTARRQTARKPRAPKAGRR